MTGLFNKLKLTLALVICSASFVTAAQDKITVGVDTAFVPFEFKQGDKYVGFDIDFAKAVADKLGMGRYRKENAYQLRIKADGFRRPHPRTAVA